MTEIIPLLDKQKESPLYTQLYTYIKKQIESGSISQGSKLPSIRELSYDLKISKNTVEAAYQQLIAEGYVESKKRNGLWVLSLEELSLTDTTDQVIPPKSQKAASFPYDFQYGDIELNRFPMTTWKKCLSDSLYKDPYQ